MVFRKMSKDCRSKSCLYQYDKKSQIWFNCIKLQIRKFDALFCWVVTVSPNFPILLKLEYLQLQIFLMHFNKPSSSLQEEYLRNTMSKVAHQIRVAFTLTANFIFNCERLWATRWNWTAWGAQSNRFLTSTYAEVLKFPAIKNVQIPIEESLKATTVKKKCLR